VISVPTFIIDDLQ